MHALIRGILAGAAGTAALNLVTYLDIAVRGRPPSSTPQRSVRRLADVAGVEIGDDEQAENRVTGMGSLLGYATGLGAGAGYALITRRRLPWPIATVALTALATVGSNAPMTALGITDPRQWTAGQWTADIVPHIAYGAVAATTLHALDRGPARRRRARR